jgi:hypothetical protein
MGEQNRETAGTSSAGKWTVMIYMAGDDGLSPLFVDQLKAIKDAGFHQDVNVLVYFDPNETGVPTRIFDVNRKRKNKRDAPQFQIGDGSDSFVRDMVEDWIRDLPRETQTSMEEGQAGTADATKSLEVFLDYALAEHRADHYVVILVGHGMVVGNDAFLPDQFPNSAIKLTDLNWIFNKRFGSGGGSLELLSMHSCAMSAIEVLYELKGTAKYLIGSEGLAFVMGWQYRQLLKKVFNGVRKAETIEQIVESLYWHTYYSARDFLLAGYPLELALCSLDPAKFVGLSASIAELVHRLRAALDTPEGIDAIQLAHLKSQSYFDENYTDIYDFCLCLAEKCTSNGLGDLREACTTLMGKLEPVEARNDVLKRFEALVIHSKHFGWKSQYSHGLSIYFPWSEPVRKSNTTVLTDYEAYAFSETFKGHESWLDFLKDYFRKTQRLSRGTEDKKRGSAHKFVDIAALGVDGIASELEQLWEGILEKPTGGSEKPTGGSGNCDCPSIKNYPRDKFEETQDEGPPPA